MLYSDVILFIFFLSFFYVSIKNIYLSLNLIVFLIPLYLFRFSLFGIPTTVLEIMIYIVSFVWFFKHRKEKESLCELSKKNKILFYGISFLFIGTALSAIFSNDLRSSLGLLKGFFIDPFLFFIVSILCVKDKKEVFILLHSFIFSAVFVGCISVAYFFMGVMTFDGRLSSFYESPNYLAMYLSPAFIFLAVLFFENKYKDEILIKKSYIIISLILVLFPLVLTKSYGALLACILSLVLFLQKKFFIYNKKIILSLLLVTIPFIFVLSFYKYEQIINSNNRSSFHSRIMIWESSLEMLKENPIWGIGGGNFQEEYLKIQYKFPPYLEWAVSQPHNVILAFYLGSGVLGVFGFFILLYYIYSAGRKDEIIFVFFLYFVFHGMVDTLYWKNDLSMIFWIVLLLCFFSYKNDQNLLKSS